MSDFASGRRPWPGARRFRTHLDAARSLCDECSASDYEPATEVK
jgi:hypothetical protein